MGTGEWNRSSSRSGFSRRQRPDAAEGLTPKKIGCPISLAIGYHQPFGKMNWSDDNMENMFRTMLKLRLFNEFLAFLLEKSELSFQSKASLTASSALFFLGKSGSWRLKLWAMCIPQKTKALMATGIFRSSERTCCAKCCFLIFWKGCFPLQKVSAYYQTWQELIEFFDERKPHNF